MGEEPHPTFRVAVVGSLPNYDRAPDRLRAAARLSAWLDTVTARAREGHRLGLVTFTAGVGTPWARERGHSIILIPRCDRTAVAERELVEFADTLVIVGSPAKWARLVRLAREAGKPVRFYGAAD